MSDVSAPSHTSSSGPPSDPVSNIRFGMLPTRLWPRREAFERVGFVFRDVGVRGWLQAALPPGWRTTWPTAVRGCCGEPSIVDGLGRPRASVRLCDTGPEVELLKRFDVVVLGPGNRPDLVVADGRVRHLSSDAGRPVMVTPDAEPGGQMADEHRRHLESRLDADRPGWRDPCSHWDDAGTEPVPTSAGTAAPGAPTRTLVVCLFGGPGTGKSATRAGVFYELKVAGVDAEESVEVVKPYLYEGRQAAIACQERVFGRQLFDLVRLAGKVRVVVTDAPILLQAYYAEKVGAPHALRDLALHHASQHETLNFLMVSDGGYDQKGRYQTETEAAQVSREIREMLDRIGAPYVVVRRERAAARIVADAVLERLRSDDLES